MRSFTERMALGRELADSARYNGRHIEKAHKSWAYQRPVANDNWSWIAEQRKHWARQCAEIRNHFAAVCLSGPNDNPANWEL